MPITWRNVAAPNFGESNQLMQTGLNTLKGAFDGIKQMGVEAETRAEDQWNRGADRIRDQYLLQAESINDVDELQAFKQKIAQQGYFDQYGGKAPQMDIMRGLNQREDAVIDSTMRRNQHADQETMRGVRNLKARAEALARQGDVAGAQQLLAQSGVDEWALNDASESIFNVQGVLEQRNQQRQQLAMQQQRLGMEQTRFQNEQNDRLRERAIDTAVAVGIEQGASPIEMIQQGIASLGPDATASERTGVARQVAEAFAAFSGIQDPVEQRAFADFATLELPKMVVSDQTEIVERMPERLQTLLKGKTVEQSVTLLEREREALDVKYQRIPEHMRPDYAGAGKTLETVMREGSGRIGADIRDVDLSNPLSWIMEQRGIILNPEDAQWLGREITQTMGVSRPDQIPEGFIQDVITGTGLARGTGSGETRLNKNRVKTYLPNWVRDFNDGTNEAASILVQKEETDAGLSAIQRWEDRQLDNYTLDSTLNKVQTMFRNP